MDEPSLDESQEVMPEVAPESASGPDVQDVTGVERNRLVAALSYLGVLVLIPLFFVDKDDPFVKFHARQGLVIFIGFILAGFIGAVVAIIGNLLSLVLALASIGGLIMALQGKLWKVPVLGDWAAKLKF